jgi:hypothetical protein
MRVSTCPNVATGVMDISFAAYLDRRRSQKKFVPDLF